MVPLSSLLARYYCVYATVRKGLIGALFSDLLSDMGNQVPAIARPFPDGSAFLPRGSGSGRFAFGGRRRSAELPRAATLGRVADARSTPTSGRSESWPLREGDAGTEQTVELIRRAVRESQSDPMVRAAAGTILRGVAANDDLAEARILYEWVRHNIRFTKDPVDFETISSARWTLTHGFGDCDDINAVLLPALLMITGHPVRLVTISNQPKAPEAFTHVYAEVEIKGRWIPIDAARRNARFGVGPSRHFRKRIWSLSSRRYQDVSGLSGAQVLGQESPWYMRIIDPVTQATSQIISAVQGVAYTPPPQIPPPPQVTAAPQPGGGYAVGVSDNVLLIGGAALVVALVAGRKK